MSTTLANGYTIETLVKGYTLRTTRQIKFEDITKLAEILTKDLSSYWKDDTLKIVPYSDSYGIGSGLLFSSKNQVGYKAMALYRYYEETTPRIIKTYLRFLDKNWIKNIDEFTCPENEDIYTLLKSYNGAPPYTEDELKIVELCFNKIDMVVISDYPTI